MSKLMSGDPSRYTNVSKKDTDFNNRVQVNTTEGSKPSLTNSKGQYTNTSRVSKNPLLQKVTEIEEEYKTQ